MGLALCISFPNFANPIARPKIWLYFCQIAVSFCGVVSRKKKQQSYWVSAPCLLEGTALYGIEVTVGASVEMPSPGLCLHPFQCTESICGCQMCPAERVGEEGPQPEL